MDHSPSKLAQHPALAEMQIITLKADKDLLRASLIAVMGFLPLSVMKRIDGVLEQTK